jgi:hypothetical protein
MTPGDQRNDHSTGTTKTARPLALYLAELRTKALAAKGAHQKFLSSLDAPPLKDAALLPGKKVRS